MGGNERDICIFDIITRVSIHLPPDSESTDELVPQRLCLSDGAESPRGHLLGVQLDGALGEIEALLHHGG